jgi:hypothetical protein
MEDRADSTALRSSLAALHHPISATTRRALKATLCEYVDRLRDLGWPPERVIIAVKQLARDAGHYPTSQVILPGVKLAANDTLLVEMVGWCIERYYYRPE